MNKLFLKEKKKRHISRGIRSAMVHSYLWLVIFPFLIAMIIFYAIYQWSFLKTYGKSTLSLLQSEQQRLTDINDNIVDESMFLYYGHVLDNLEQEPLSEETEDWFRPEMEHAITIYPNLSTIVCFYGDTTIISGKYYDSLDEKLKKYDDMLIAEKGKPVWLTSLYLLPVNQTGYKMILGRAINNSKREPIATLYFVIDTKIMSDIISQDKNGSDKIYLINENNIILNASERSEIGNKLDSDTINLFNKNGYHAEWVDGKRVEVIYAKSYKTGWTLVQITPIDDIMPGLLSVQLTLLIVGAIYLIFLWMMLRFANTRILIPITKLSLAMDDFASGNRDAQADADEPGELGSLNRHFNQMTERINDLIDENERQNAEKNNFKIRALSAQLSPHFIYNALNTIKWIAVINKQDNIKNLTDALIHLLMNAAKSGEDYYTIEDEISVIKSYVVIQKARFMNFTMQYDIDDSIMKYKIRKFLIQPIVENSIVHGFGRGTLPNGVIKIHIYADENLHIEVEDNGCGFDTAILKNRDNNTGNENSSEHAGIAIANVQQIISIEYGIPYYLEICSEPGKGTKATYLLPII